MRVTTKGATNQVIYLEVLDSSSTTGARRTGLLYNTASLVASYARNGAARVAITLATQTVTGAWTSGGFVEVDATNMPGLYRLDVPDAAFASGADSVVITLRGAATMVQVSEEVQLIAANLQDAVRAGLTALPNAAAEAAGGLYTRGVGAGQINQDANGRVDTRTAAMAADVMTAAALAADFTVENNAPVLAVLGALANAASSGDPNTSNTIVQMLKQITNTLEGSAGIPTYPAAAAPANAVSLAEAIRQIYTNVGLQATSAQAVAIQADTDDIQTRLPAALVSGRMDSSVGAMAANVMTAAAADPTLANEVADQVWDEVISGHLTSGTTGRALNDANTLAGQAYTAIAGVQADTDDIQTRLPAALVSGRMDSSVGAMAANVMTGAAADPTLANEIADQVWDEALAGHLGAGSTGAALNGAGAAGDPWTTPLPGAYGAGTAGNIIGNLDDQVAAVQADTDNIQTRLPAALVGGKMDSTGGAGADPWLTPVPGAYAAGTAGNVLGSRLDATVSSRATPAQVNTEVVDALNVDVYAEPVQGAPAVSTSLAAKINYLYKFLRNRITSSETEIRVYNDAGTVVDHKAPHADAAGVYDRSEFVSGP